MSQPLLQTTAVAKAFGPVVALRAVDLSVAPGEVHALLGANGAGKSTLVKILTGVLRNDSGTVAVNGEPVLLRSPTEARARGLAPVYQDPALIRDLTVAQNLRLTGVEVADVRRELAAMDLDGLDLDEQVRDIPLPFLRMLDLARALVFDPQLLVLDEITAALPPDLSERVFAIMGRWKKRDRSVLFISHRLAEVREHCDMCTVLRDGRNVASFHPGEGGESQIVAAMLGEASAGVRDVARERRAARERDEEEAPRLVVRDLLIDRQDAGVSFEVRAGEVLGLAALEGQGQDRLFEILSGNARAAGGEI
ncbi:MAG: ATP-binding cassette domain-containing protein, partial [Actinomycetota bacterium]